jgi:hypothetical protein
LFGADLEHLHHRLLRHGFSQRKVALYLYGVSAVLVGVNWLAMLYKGQTVGLYLLVFAAAAFVVIRHVAHVELWNSSLALASGLRRPPLKQLTVPLYLAADVALLAGAFVVSHLCFLPHAAHEVLRQWLLRDAVVGVGVPLLCLMAGATYQRVWSRLSGIDCIMLTWWLLIGVVLGTGVLSFFAAEATGVLMAEMGLYFIFALVALLGTRIFPRFVAGCLTYMSRGYNPENEPRQRILIYGAGAQGMLFLRAEGQRILKKARQYTVVGFLDDDRNLHGRLVCGYKVLGGLADLEGILQKHRIERLILTFELSPTALVALTQVLAKHGVAPLLWSTTLLPPDGDVLSLPVLRGSPCHDCPAHQSRPMILPTSDVRSG